MRMCSGVTRGIALIALAIGRTALCATFHVPGDSATIQGAIDAARNGDHILVDHGFYSEFIDTQGKAISLRATGDVNQTVISAPTPGAVVRCEGGETGATIIEGFTITGGKAPEGAGLRIVGASPTFKGCVVQVNKAGLRGAGAYIESGAPTFIGCVIVGNSLNSAGVGGGGVCAIDAAPTFIGCSISDNSAIGEATDFETLCLQSVGSGAGLLALGSTVTLDACAMIDNASGATGGAVSVQGGSLHATDCVFSENVAISSAVCPSFELGPTVTSGHGGAIEALAALVHLERCTLDASQVGECGGAIYLDGGSATIMNCSILNSQAIGGITEQGAKGQIIKSPLGSGGALFARGGAQVEVTSSLIAHNHAAVHAPIAMVLGADGGDASLALNHCTMVGNNDASGGKGGPPPTPPGALGVGESRGCIFWDNPAASPIVALLAVSHSLVDAPTPGPGNVVAPPGFVDMKAGDYRLTPGSPAIDAGDAGALPEPAAASLDGVARRLDDPATPDTGIASIAGLVPDMGAFEFLHEGACPTDVTGDGVVDAHDLNALLVAISNPEGSTLCDIDGDGGVDVADLNLVLAQFGLGCP